MIEKAAAIPKQRRSQKSPRMPFSAPPIAIQRRSWAMLGRSWGYLRRSSGHLGAILGQSGSILTKLESLGAGIQPSKSMHRAEAGAPFFPESSSHCRKTIVFAWSCNGATWGIQKMCFVRDVLTVSAPRRHGATCR